MTPAAGYVGPAGGLVCGILGGILCYYATRFVLGRLLVDDSLDVFAVHGVGGILGTLLVAVLGAETFGGLGLENGIVSQFISQATGVVVVVVWSVLATWLIVLLTRAMVGLRVSEKEEAEGLDFESTESAATPRSGTGGGQHKTRVDLHIGRVSRNGYAAIGPVVALERRTCRRLYRLGGWN